jgi:hypothetical protein
MNTLVDDVLGSVVEGKHGQEAQCLPENHRVHSAKWLHADRKTINHYRSHDPDSRPFFRIATDGRFFAIITFFVKIRIR